MEEFLGRHGFRVAVMKADAVPPGRREAWVAQRVEEGVDVLICHSRLVQTDLDLVDFPTIVWFETEVSVFQSTPNTALLLGRGLASERRVERFADLEAGVLTATARNGVPTTNVAVRTRPCSARGRAEVPDLVEVRARV